jgi:protein-disulfide isomerase
MVRKVIIFILAIGAIAGGYFLGGRNWNIGGSAAVSKFACPNPGAAVAGDDVERKCVPFEGKAKGSSKAQVTIVEFSDFQCPFCSRVLPTLDKLIKDYPDKIRVFFKHNPLPFHSDAPLAAQAAVAAEAQGKFWQMHDILFKNQQNIKRPDLEKYAKEIGLNMDKFKAAIDSHKFAAQIEADTKQGSELGVSGTPAAFVNGQLVSGAQPVEAFKKIVEADLKGGAKAKAKAN